MRILLTWGVAAGLAAAADAVGKAQLVEVRRIWDKAPHNAFTDLQYWQGNYWVGYRKGAGHISMDGEAVISVSADRRRFREVARGQFELAK